MRFLYSVFLRVGCLVLFRAWGLGFRFSGLSFGLLLLDVVGVLEDFEADELRIGLQSLLLHQGQCKHGLGFKDMNSGGTCIFRAF